MNWTLNFMIILLNIVLYSFTNGGQSYLPRQHRAIGGESLDTSKYILYIDANSSRFIEVPQEYMKNWIDDQKMWRTWSIVLAVMCFIFFAILMAFLIRGFIASNGSFSNLKKDVNENLSNTKIISSSTTETSNYPQMNDVITSRHRSTL